MTVKPFLTELTEAGVFWEFSLLELVHVVHLHQIHNEVLSTMVVSAGFVQLLVFLPRPCFQLLLLSQCPQYQVQDLLKPVYFYNRMDIRNQFSCIQDANTLRHFFINVQGDVYHISTANLSPMTSTTIWLSSITLSLFKFHHSIYQPISIEQIVLN